MQKMTTLQTLGNRAYAQSIQINGRVHENINLPGIPNLKTFNLPIANGASFDSHIKEHNLRCIPNTRIELLRYIREWVKDRNGTPIFWLSGMAGTGKPTIARAVAQSFADQGQSCLTGGLISLC
jgi:Mrp family chromosome partitioning ATPase